MANPPALQDILTAGQERGIEPERLAAGIRRWQADMLATGRERYGAAPDKYWKIASGVEQDVNAAMMDLSSQAAARETAAAFPDPEQRMQFLSVLESSGHDPDRMDAPPAWQAAARKAGDAAAAPVFKTHGVQLGTIGQGPNTLAVYEVRRKPDGGYEAYVQPQVGDKPGRPVVVPLSGDTQSFLTNAQTRKAKADRDYEMYAPTTEGMGYMETGGGPVSGEVIDSLNRRVESAAARLATAERGRLSEILHLELDEQLRGNKQFLDELPQHWGEQLVARPLASVARSLAQSTAALTSVGADSLTAEGQEAVDVQTPGALRSRYAAGEDSSVADMISQGIESAAVLLGPTAAARGAALIPGAIGRAGAAATRMAGATGWSGMYSTAFGANFAGALQEADQLQQTNPEKAERIRRLSYFSAATKAGIELATERIFGDEARLMAGGRVPWRSIATQPLKESVEEGVGGYAQNAVSGVTGERAQDPLQQAEGGFWGSLPFVGASVVRRALQARSRNAPPAGPPPAAEAAPPPAPPPADGGPDASLFPGGAPSGPDAAAPAADAETAPAMGQPAAFDATPPEGAADPTAEPLVGAPPPAGTSPGETFGAQNDVTGNPISPPPLTPATEQDPTGTVPETPATLAEQRRRVLTGQRPAMMFPGLTADQVPRALAPGQDDGLILTETPAGTFLHPYDISSAEILTAVETGNTGYLLGMGLPAKPQVDANGTVVQRTADGTEVTAAVVSPDTIAAATTALRAAASPGDTFTLETPRDVVASRLTGAPPVMAPEVDTGRETGAGEISSTPAPATPESVEGEQLNRRWTAFSPESGSLGIPRAEMPQIQSEHRGALVNFLNARGVAHERQEVRPDALKPTQAEYSPGKVAKARKFDGTPRAILVSADNHVVDGHHQWVAALDNPDQPIPIMRLKAPIRDLIPMVNEFPSASQTGGGAAVRTREDNTLREPGPDIAHLLRPAYDRLVQRRGTDSVFISDLQRESGLPLADVQRWIYDYGINQGQATADTGDWSHATEEQRAAHVMLRDQYRLYIRLHPGVGMGPPPAAALAAQPVVAPAAAAAYTQQRGAPAQHPSQPVLAATLRRAATDPAYRRPFPLLGRGGSQAFPLLSGPGGGGTVDGGAAGARAAGTGRRVELTQAERYRDLAEGRSADFTAGPRITSVMADLVDGTIPAWDIRGKTIATPADFALLLQPLRSPLFESLKIAVLDAQNRVIHAQVLTVGSLAEATAHPRDVLRVVETARAAGGPAPVAVMIAHNHPSGVVTPSGADEVITHRMEAVCREAGVELRDHVITNGQTFYSFTNRERGNLDASTPMAPWETVPAAERARVRPGDYTFLVRLLRQDAAGHGHVVYVDTRGGMLAVERFADTAAPEIARRAMAGASTLGAASVMLDLAHLPEGQPLRNAVRDVRDRLQVAGVALADVADQTIDSWHAEGMLREDGGPMSQNTEDGFTVREDPEPPLTDSPVPAVPENPVNIFGQRVQADDRLRASWRASFNPREYNAWTEEQLVRNVREWIGREGGMEGAARLFLDPNSGLLDYERNALGQVLAIGLDKRAGRAQLMGNAPATAEAEGLLDTVIGRLEELATQAGQALRAFGLWAKLSPRGIVRAVERKTADTRRRHVRETLPVSPEDGTRIVPRTREEAEQEQRQERGDRTQAIVDSWLNRLSRSQSDTLSWGTPAQISELEKLIRAHMKEINPLFAQQAVALKVPENDAMILDRLVLEEHRRRAAIEREREWQKLIDREARKAKKQPDDGVPPAVRSLLDRLARSQSDTLSWGKKREPTALEKLIKAHLKEAVPDFVAQATALGLPAHEADTAHRMILEEHRRRAAIAQAREQQKQKKEKEASAIPELVTNLIDRLSRSQSDTMEWTRRPEPTALAKLINDHMRQVNPEFVDQATALGLPAQEANLLDRLVLEEHRRSVAIAAEKTRQRLVDQLTAPKASRATRAKIPPLVDALLKARSAGNLTSADFLDAYSKAFNLPRFTPEFAAQVRSLAERAEASPAGSWLRVMAQQQLMARLALWEGIPVRDMFVGFWYANILSGLGTQLVNISGNSVHLMLKTVQVALTNNPKHTAQFVRGMIKGAAEGMQQARAAWTNGEPVMKGESEWQRQQVLEMMWSDDPQTLRGHIARYGAASWGRYVFRGLTAMDSFFFNTAKEGRAWLETSRALASGQTMEEALGFDAPSWADAQTQASDDLRAAGIRTPTTRQVDRRAFEIVESRRSTETLAESRRFGAQTTFNYQPEGFMGAVAHAVNYMVGAVPPVRMLVPFVNIVANVADQSMNWTPVGVVRAGLGRHIFNSKDARYTYQERVEMAVSGTLATLGAAALYAIAKGYEDRDDDSVPFMIYGMGPQDKGKRAQMPKGWRSFSVKIGDTYLSYAETPLGLILSTVGTAMDRRRYTTKQEMDEPMERAAALMMGAGQSLMRTGVLSSLDKMFGIIDGTAKPTKVAYRTAAGLIPAQGLLRSVAQFMDPVMLDTSTFQGTLMSNLPVIRSYGQPMLNVFGENVREPGPWLISRLATRQDRSDTEATWLAARKLTIPSLNDEVAVGQYLPANEMEAMGKVWQTGLTGLEADRKVRAITLERLASGYLTADERTKFLRLTGPRIREAVRTLRRELDTKSFIPAKPEEIQRRLSGKVMTIRKQARVEMVR